MTIYKIEAMTQKDAEKIAIETVEIKGHTVILADLGNLFGFSALVFKDGKHVYHANDYALHHPGKRTQGIAALKEWYIKVLSDKLFTDEELLQEVKSYDEYQRKQYFLGNLYIQRYDYVSAYGITKEDFKEIEEGRKRCPYFNPVSYCYVSNNDIINEQLQYAKHLQKSFSALKDDLKTFREMVARELINHEAGYTGDYEDGLAALGLRYEDLISSKKTIVMEELRKLTGM